MVVTHSKPGSGTKQKGGEVIPALTAYLYKGRRPKEPARH
jgi:hypothetical protein